MTDLIHPGREPPGICCTADSLSLVLRYADSPEINLQKRCYTGSRTQIHGDIFQRNQSGERIAVALVRLEEMGLARKIPKEGESREGVAWVASSPFAMNEFYEQSDSGVGGADGNS